MTAELAADLADVKSVRLPFTCGALVWPAFCDAVAYGRAHGCNIQLYRGGGWLARRGWIVATGLREHVDRFIAVLGRTCAATEGAP